MLGAARLLRAAPLLAALLLLAAHAAARSRPTHYENTFAPGEALELRVYLSPTPRFADFNNSCLLYTSPSPRDGLLSRMPSSA